MKKLMHVRVKLICIESKILFYFKESKRLCAWVSQCVCRILFTEIPKENSYQPRRFADSRIRETRDLSRNHRAHDSRISNNHVFASDSAPSLASNNACIKGARDNQS